MGLLFSVSDSFAHVLSYVVLGRGLCSSRQTSWSNGAAIKKNNACGVAPSGPVCFPSQQPFALRHTYAMRRKTIR